MVSKEKYYKLAEKQEQLITYLTNNDDERIEMLNQFYKITKELDFALSKSQLTQMKRKKYINDLVEMEMECDVQVRVGTTIEKVREYFEDLDYDELEICWRDSPYCQFYLKEEE